MKLSLYVYAWDRRQHGIGRGTGYTDPRNWVQRAHNFDTQDLGDVSKCDCAEQSSVPGLKEVIEEHDFWAVWCGRTLWWKRYRRAQLQVRFRRDELGRVLALTNKAGLPNDFLKNLEVNV